MPDSKRLYGETEIRDILQRAASLQERQIAPPTTGLSASELERLGEEVGIDPHFIRAAIEGATPAGRAPTQSGGLFGAPTELRMTRVMQGEVDDATWEEIVAQLRHHYGGPGMAGKLGRMYEWSHKLPNTSDTFHVTLAPSRGRTRLRLTLPNTNAFGGFYGGGSGIAMAVVMVSIAAFQHIPIVAALAAVTSLLAVFLVLRFFVMKHFQRRERIAADVLDEIEALIEPTDPALAEDAAYAKGAEETVRESDGEQAPPLAAMLDDEAPATASRRKRTRRSRG